MKKACEFYINHARLIGVFYCTVPTIAWFVYVLATVPFREVYLLRLLLCLTVGNTIAAYLNQLGMKLWLAKHYSNEGPATIIDGAYNGAAIGFGIALLTALTSLIGTQHPETAKTFIIAVYIASAFLGACIGSLVAAIGRRYLER